METNGFKKARITKTASKKLKGLYERGGVWWLAFTPANGAKREFVSLGTKNYEEAVGLGVKIKSQPKFQRADRISDESKFFLQTKKARGDYGRHTNEWSKSAIHQFAVFAHDIGAAKVTGEHIEEYWVHLLRTVSENSAASYMRALRSFFSWLEEKHRIPKSPFADFRVPKLTQPARLRFCTEEERDRLIDNCEDWDLKFVLMCGFHAGMRRMEICEARDTWFHLERGSIAVEKTPTFRPKDRETRDIPMTTTFLRFLATYPLPHPWVLKPNVKHGKALYRYDFRAPFETYMDKQGCPWVTPHVMRHTFGALYISAGGSLFRLSRYLGDTPETTDKHYAHLVQDREDINRSHRS